MTRFETWTMLTNEELKDGASCHQEAVRYAHAEAVDSMRRGMPDYAAEWQKVAAVNHHAATELMRFLLRRPH